MSARGQNSGDIHPAHAARAPLKRRQTSGQLEPTKRLSVDVSLSKATDGSKTSRRPSSSKVRKANASLNSKARVPSEPTSFPAQGGPVPNETQFMLVSLLLEIRETHRRRQDFHRAEKSLTLQIKAIERRLGLANLCLTPTAPVSDLTAPSLDAQDHSASDDQHPTVESIDLSIGAGDQRISVTPVTYVPGADPFWPTLPLQEARAVIKKQRLVVERSLVKLSKRLPVWPWVEAVNGFGALGLAQIVGEAGDLSNYANPGKLWKRMGLAVFNGKSQRRVSGAGAIEQGYSPQRRAIMFCIGDSLLKKQNTYRELYLARKILEQSKVPDGTKMLWHRRAQRYAEKRLLKNLWQAWRNDSVGT